jgi:hypothetical protein
MDNGDGIAVGWLGHPVFRNKEGRELFVRRKSEKGTLVMTPRTTPQGFSGFFFVSEEKGR